MNQIEMQEAEFTTLETIAEHIDATYAGVEAEAEEQALDVILTDLEIEAIECILKGMVNDDVYIIDKFINLFSKSNLTIDSMIFRDVDDDQAYSMLGLAKSMGALGVVAYLNKLGCIDDFVDESITFH